MSEYPFIPNIIGLFGVSLIVIAYLRIQTHQWKASDFIFPLTNLIGAICILFSLLFNWNLSSVVIELIWITISLFGLFSIFRNKRTENGITPEEHLELGWSLNSDRVLQKSWQFHSTSEVMEFIERATLLSENFKSKPTLIVVGKRVTITLESANEASTSSFLKELK